MAGQKVDFPPFVEINDSTNEKYVLGYKDVALKTEGEDENEG